MTSTQASIDLDDANTEAAIVGRLAARSASQFLQSLALISDSYLSQILIALWDSGLYEYVRTHERIEIKLAADELGLDENVLQWLLEYLVGRGIMKPEGTAVVLSEQGQPYWNYLTRGVLTCHLGGYNPMLTRLGPLLRKEIGLDDPSLSRSGRLVAMGAGYTILANGTIPWVLSIIKELGGQFVLDLGCGVGDFLIQLALTWPHGRGVGIDMDAEAIAEAKKKAEKYDVANRIAFQQAELSDKPMRMEEDALANIDTLTAIFMLHEFGGRGGASAISTAIGSLNKQFPGRKLLMVEGTRADPSALCASPPRTYGQLDYSFLHPLSRQGPLRTPDEWKQIIESAGATLLDRIPGFRLIPSWVSLYVIGLG